MEQFVCHLYNFPEDKDINEVRCQRFISQIIKKINPETLPSTKNEFFLPMKRSNYEIKDEISIPITPRTLLPQDHGCQLKDGKIEVQWIDQPFSPSSLNEITSCTPVSNNRGEGGGGGS